MRADPTEQDSLQQGPSACRVHCLGVLFVGVVGGALMWSEAHHWVCWLWGLLSGAMAQAKVNCYLCLVQHHQVSTTK